MSVRIVATLLVCGCGFTAHLRAPVGVRLPMPAHRHGPGFVCDEAYQHTEKQLREVLRRAVHTCGARAYVKRDDTRNTRPRWVCLRHGPVPASEVQDVTDTPKQSWVIGWRRMSS